MFSQRSFYKLSSHYFSTLAKGHSFKNARKVILSRKREEDGYNVYLSLDNTNKTIILSINDESTIKNFIDQIKQQSDIKGDIKAYTVDQVQLSDQVKIDDLAGSQFYVADNKGELLLLAQNHDEQYEKKESHDKVAQLLEESGSSYVQQQVILNYLKRVDSIARVKTGREVFSDEGKKSQTSIKKADLIKSLIEGIPTNKNLYSEAEQSLIFRYQQLQKLNAQMQTAHDQISLIGNKTVRRNMVLGLVALIGQFAIMAAGTYQVYSWDIMEPIGYFMTSGGLIYLSTHFFKYQQDYSNETFYSYLHKKQLKKLYSKYGFDYEQFEKVQKELIDIERQLKTNFLFSS